MQASAQAVHDWAELRHSSMHRVSASVSTSRVPGCVNTISLAKVIASSFVILVIDPRVPDSHGKGHFYHFVRRVGSQLPSRPSAATRGTRMHATSSRETHF